MTNACQAFVTAVQTVDGRPRVHVFVAGLTTLSLHGQSSAQGQCLSGNWASLTAAVGVVPAFIHPILHAKVLSVPSRIMLHLGP